MVKPKIAIVADWLTSQGGAERVVAALKEAFPDADVYTSVYEPHALLSLNIKDVRTTWLQKFPRFLRKLHKFFPVLRVWAFRSLNLKDYDIIISSSSAESKQVRKRKDAIHICYCHTPIRYYWSHYHEYKSHPGFGIFNPLIRLIMPPFVWWMRKVDLKGVKGVDFFIANSTTTQKRIQQYYRRESDVIHPPVDLERFLKVDIDGPRKGFLVHGRQVPYKRFDLAIAACNKLGKPLTVSGGGSEHKKLKAMAGPTITFVEDPSDEVVNNLFASHQGFITPQEEDFGIVQVEAMATGCPVIAYGKGGVRDSVIDGKTGVFFIEQSVHSLETALIRFPDYRFDPHALQQHAKRFEKKKFIANMQKFVSEKSTNKEVA